MAAGQSRIVILAETEDLDRDSRSNTRSNLILTSLSGEDAANEVYDKMFSVQAVRGREICNGPAD